MEATWVFTRVVKVKRGPLRGSHRPLRSEATHIATYPRGYICSQREVGDLQNMETNTNEKIITYTILNLLLYNCDLEPSEPEQRG